MVYKATLGITSTVITVVISLLLGSLVAFLLYRAVISPEIIESIVAIVMVIAISALYLCVYLFRPIHYILDSESLVIKRPVRDVIIPICEIRDAFIVKKESMTWTERVGGNGGLFGFFGDFKNTFGHLTWYATKLRNYIMIETVNNGKIIITPDNTEMVIAIRKLIAR